MFEFSPHSPVSQFRSPATDIPLSNTLYLFHLMTCKFSIWKSNEVYSIPPVSFQTLRSSEFKDDFWNT